MKTLYLYTTLGCQLCDKAKTLMWPVLEHHGYRLQDVEIAGDEELLKLYQTRIPVVRRDDRQNELGWPFTSKQLSNYLSAD